MTNQNTQSLLYDLLNDHISEIFKLQEYLYHIKRNAKGRDKKLVESAISKLFQCSGDIRVIFDKAGEVWCE